MSKPSVSYRRLGDLKKVAYACGLLNSDARKFGKITKTSTWETLLSSRGLNFVSKAEHKRSLEEG